MENPEPSNITINQKTGNRHIRMNSDAKLGLLSLGLDDDKKEKKGKCTIF